MDYDLPYGLAVQRDVLIRDVYVAFKDVGRFGGVSWSEADVIDDYGSDEQRRIARASDREPNWMALVDAPDWPSSHESEWSFLDAIGFRYYFAAEVVGMLKFSEGNDWSWRLNLGAHPHRAYTLQQWSALDDDPLRIVRRFVEHMIAVYRARGDRLETKAWRQAYRSYWDAVPSGLHRK